MSVKEVADKINVSQQTLNNNLNKGYLDIEEYSKILNLLNIPSHWFITPSHHFGGMREMFVKENLEVLKMYPEYRDILINNNLEIDGVIIDTLDNSASSNENINESDSTYLLKLVIEDHEKRIKNLESKIDKLIDKKESKSTIKPKKQVLKIR